MSNLQEYLAGTDPTNSLSSFRIVSLVAEGGSLRVTWTASVQKTNALQTSSDPVTNYTDIFVVTNTVFGVTNYLDSGASTNVPARYYRVRLVP